MCPPYHLLAIVSLLGAAYLASTTRPPPLVILDLNTHSFSSWNIHVRTLLVHHGVLHHIDGSVLWEPTDATYVQDDFAMLNALHDLISSNVLDIIQSNAPRATYVPTAS